MASAAKKAALAELTRMMKERGVLTPREVVDAAADDSSPLRVMFCWDNDECGDRYRLIQARELIRELKVEIRVEDVVVRVPAMVHTPEETTGRDTYTETVRLRSKEDLARDALNREMVRMEQQIARARALAKVFGMESELETLLAEVTRIRETITA